MLDVIESVLFFGIGPLLWVSGLSLFIRSPLSQRRKLIWTSVLFGVGAAVGMLLPAPAIREKFALVIALLPLLAVADVKLMSSHRSFTFWLRACGFEVCTVFAVAAAWRSVLDVSRR